VAFKNQAQQESPGGLASRGPRQGTRKRGATRSQLKSYQESQDPSFIRAYSHVYVSTITPNAGRRSPRFEKI